MTVRSWALGLVRWVDDLVLVVPDLLLGRLPIHDVAGTRVTLSYAILVDWLLSWILSWIVTHTLTPPWNDLLAEFVLMGCLALLGMALNQRQRIGSVSVAYIVAGLPFNIILMPLGLIQSWATARTWAFGASFLVVVIVGMLWAQSRILAQGYDINRFTSFGLSFAIFCVLMAIIY